MSDWFQVREIAPGALMLDEPGHVQSYLLLGNEAALLIDTGLGLADLGPVVRSLTEKPIKVVNTHWHFDHLGSNASFEVIGCSAIEAPRLAFDYPNQYLQDIYLSYCRGEGLTLPRGFDPAAYTISGKKPTFSLAEGQIIDLGDRRVEVLLTPGHTAGSLSLLDLKTGLLFCGDLAYPGTIYAMFDDSSPADYAATLARLLERKADFSGLCPGHHPEILPPSWLSDLEAAFGAVLSGRKPDVIDSDWGAPCPRHLFGPFDILIGPPGGEGIDIRP